MKVSVQPGARGIDHRCTDRADRRTVCLHTMAVDDIIINHRCQSPFNGIRGVITSTIAASWQRGDDISLQYK
ncbi:hypothetical protein F2P81_009020 [Scophthalmus maximus]|uniref:Uncharacterized protein n=1 Tax=Scophthalmus maximus TaxID=52904 RepID=A0A6A4STI1_SCOMX|nr:hypothetical protein F2P81_009020 [Scophthalmus maximus]